MGVCIIFLFGRWRRVSVSFLFVPCPFRFLWFPPEGLLYSMRVAGRGRPDSYIYIYIGRFPGSIEAGCDLTSIPKKGNKTLLPICPTYIYIYMVPA
jgi:hypothetical protein